MGSTGPKRRGAAWDAAVAFQLSERGRGTFRDEPIVTTALVRIMSWACGVCEFLNGKVTAPFFCEKGPLKKGEAWQRGGMPGSLRGVRLSGESPAFALGKKAEQSLFLGRG